MSTKSIFTVTGVVLLVFSVIGNISSQWQINALRQTVSDNADKSFKRDNDIGQNIGLNGKDDFETQKGVIRIETVLPADSKAALVELKSLNEEWKATQAAHRPWHSGEDPAYIKAGAPEE